MTAKTWNGASADWTVAADWTPSGQPGADDSVAVDAGTVSVTSDVGEVGSLSLANGSLDVGTGAQPGQLAVAGALTSGGVLDIGGATAPSTVTVGSLVNFAGGVYGSIDLQGVAAGPATLDVDAAAGFGAAGAVEGSVNLNGDAVIAFASGGIDLIDAESELSLLGNHAFVADSDDLTANGALAGLATVKGALNLQYGASLSLDGALSITGEVNVDAYGTGGSSLTVQGAISNDGELNIGDGATLTSPTTVTTTALNNFINPTLGAIDIDGGAGTLAEVDVTTGVAGLGKAGVLYGTVTLSDDALLEFASGSLATIAANSKLNLAGAKAFVADANNVGDNSALTGLTSNSGGLYLTGGAEIATSAGLTNNGSIGVDDARGAGGSTLSVGGALVNAGNIYVGDGGSVAGASTIVSTGVNNSANAVIDLSGNAGSSLPGLAMWDVTQGSAGFGVAGEVIGHIELGGDALFEFASGEITSIVSGAELELSGPDARVANASDTDDNSALTGLATISGALELDDVALSTTGPLTIGADGGVTVDQGDDQGGSTLSIGGAIDNEGGIQIGGGAQLVANATVEATSLSQLDGGGILLEGDDDAPEPVTAALVLSGAAGFGDSGVLSGDVALFGPSSIDFGSGEISEIGSGATLTLDGDDAFISDASDTGANSALMGITQILGYVYLEDGARIETTQGVVNNGILSLDGAGSGGSSVTIAGAFLNDDLLTLGGAGSATFTAASLTNGNSGKVTVAAGSTLTLTSGPFTQDAPLSEYDSAGYTEIAGALDSAVDLEGGQFKIDSGGSVSGPIDFAGAAELTLGAPLAAANVLSGLAYGDTLLLEYLLYSASDSVVLQSSSDGVQTFAIEDGSGDVLTTLNVSGSHDPSFFNLEDDEGETEIATGQALTITGTSSGQQTANLEPTHPFANVTFTSNVPYGNSFALAVTLSNSANGTLSDYTEGGAGDAAQVTAELREIVFTPTAAAGTTSTTTFTITVQGESEVFSGGLSDSTTAVTATSYTGGGQTLGLGGAPGYGVSVYDTAGNWDLIGGSNGFVYLTEAQASVVGGGDAINLQGDSGNQASLYDTDDNWDAVKGSNASIYLTDSQAAVYGGADTVELLGSAGDAVSLYNSSGSWDVVAGDGGTIYLTDAQASAFGGGDIVNLQGTTGNQVSLYNTANVWDTVQAIDGGLATIYLTDAQASVLGGGESVYLLGTSGNQISLYKTAGDWDGVTGSDASISLTSAQASVTGGGDTFYLLGDAGDALSLYGTNNNWDLVSGSSATIYLTSAQTSVSGSLDAIDFAGGADDAVSLYNTNGSWDTIQGSHGTVYLTSSQTSVSGGGNTINFSGGTGNIVSLAQTAGLADTVLGSNGTADLYGAQLIVNGSNDTLNMNNNSTATLKGASTLIAFDQGIGGQDVINGFASSDKIQLSKSDFANFSALSSHLSQVNSSAVITLNASDTIELTFVTVASLTAAQFSFV